MRKIKLTIAALIFGALTVQAQQATVPNVLNLRSAKSSGEIIENNKLVGYYVFFTKEKADKKNTAYEIELFDDNYNSTKKFEIIRPKQSYLAEVVYNGEAFMLHFYDKKTGYEFVTFDRSGNQLGSNKILKDDLSKYELGRLEQNLATKTENVTIYPNGKNGFIRSTFLKNKKVGYEIVCFDNNAKQLWAYGSNPSSKLLETIEIVDVSENVMSATIYKKKSLMTKEVDLFCLLLDPKTGDEIKEFPLGTDETGRKSVLKSFVNEKTEKLMIVGEFFKPKDDIFKDKSQGLFVMELSIGGEELSTTQYKWKGDIDKFKQENLDEEDKKDANKSFYIFFHDVIVSENGHIFLIGEQFIKQVSAGGVAMNVLNAAAGGGSSGASNFEILVANMIVIELGENKEMLDFDLIKKKKTSVLLPSGMGVYGATFLGYYINSAGGFDYSFTSRDKESDAYDVVYIDANRKEEKNSEKSDRIVGVISIKGGTKTENRVPINCQAKTFWIQPAKPGFISVTEYSRKEKTLNMRLEQLSY